MLSSADGAFCLLERLSAFGVRNAVLAPGSRSRALALAAASLERQSRWSLTVRVDERSAAFMALGMGLARREPAVVITTSGSAVANLYPAVVEAHHALVPLLVITADRPVRLHGTRSNQTMLQRGFFGDWARSSVHLEAGADAAQIEQAARRAWLEAVGAESGCPGPVHINMAFDEPLSGPVPAAGVPGLIDLDAAKSAELLPAAPAAFPGRGSVTLTRGPATVVIAGHGAGAAASALAEEAGWPLVAEVGSGARFGPQLVPDYRRWLPQARLERAVVFGHPTLSREVPQLLSRPELEVIVVAPQGREYYDPGRQARVCGRVELGPPSPLMSAAASAQPAAETSEPQPEQAPAGGPPITREQLVAAVWELTAPTQPLFWGSSRIIRVADQTLPGKAMRVFANRGLSGIDGNLSTAAGIALAYGRPTRAVVGDLTAWHDIGALLIPTQEKPLPLQVIVANDHGGTIFDTLEITAADPADFTRVMTVPCAADLESITRGFGWSYRRCPDEASLRAALTPLPPAPGPDTSNWPQLIEVPLARR